MAQESRIAVYGALAGNLAIAITKFIGAAVTGSSAMLSEAVHSTVDTGDQILMLIGMRRARRPPDLDHPFGHGKELYFWSLIVAVLIFGLGGGVSAYEGVTHVLHPAPVQDPTWSYVVLACAFVFEGASFSIGLWSLSKERGSPELWTKFLGSKDPTTYTVVAEDAAALLGVVIAFAGIYSSRALSMPVLDGVASIVIGVLLGGVAIFLIAQSRGLLVGEAVAPGTARQILEIAESVEKVQAVSSPLTMYLGPESVLLTLTVKLAPDTPAPELSVVVERIKLRIRQKFPRIQRIYIEAEVSTPAV